MDDISTGSAPEASPAAARSNGRTQPFDAALGARVRALRTGAGMTQTALGDAVGVSFQQVQKYELGKDRMSAATLFLFATALNVPVASFYEGAPQHVPAKSGVIVGDALSVKIVVLFQRIHDDRVRKQLLALAEMLAKEQPRGAPEAADEGES